MTIKGATLLQNPELMNPKPTAKTTAETPIDTNAIIERLYPNAHHLATNDLGKLKLKTTDLKDLSIDSLGRICHKGKVITSGDTQMGRGGTVKATNYPEIRKILKEVTAEKSKRLANEAEARQAAQEAAATATAKAKAEALQKAEQARQATSDAKKTKAEEKACTDHFIASERTEAKSPKADYKKNAEAARKEAIKAKKAAEARAKALETANKLTAKDLKKAEINNSEFRFSAAEKEYLTTLGYTTNGNDRYSKNNQPIPAEKILHIIDTRRTVQLQACSNSLAIKTKLGHCNKPQEQTSLETKLKQAELLTTEAAINDATNKQLGITAKK